MEQLRIGVIGVGRFGRLHMKVLNQIAGCTVTAIADVDDDLLRETSKEFNIEAVFNDAFELIRHPDVDVIDIVSNEDTHGPFAIEAIKQGKHVFIEKPIATKHEEALEIEKLAKEHNVQVMVGNISRFSQPYVAMKRSLAKGLLGSIAMIRAKRNFSKDWFDHFGHRVHPVYESGIHDIDLILWYAESACRQVFAVERNISGYQYPDLFSAILTFENGIVAALDSAWLYPKGGPVNLVETLDLAGTIDADIEIIGNTGTANFKLAHSGYSLWTDAKVYHPELTFWTTEHDGIGGAIRAELNHFILQVHKKEASPIAPLRDSVEASRIADAIVLSAKENRPVAL
ncbi:Gfo/Idh/MocA family oxidoreductase [Planococcus sp. N028]|uniref:Gfo/Idh/MocA family oxidoreductase n=1 Tax=Planococcus shixiaomingii TaxID=3058393 RepID=A0ABT8N5R1_9BACL|nr:Gfo/Idh/MocA family oxidoreductase [Planococcus sp. N028]MDN7242885.1 Gfo/Idh/MocA family oxidoreductase [Planococcus sp. N028]